MQYNLRLFLLLTACTPYSHAVEPVLGGRGADGGVQAVSLQHVQFAVPGGSGPTTHRGAPAPGDARVRENVFPDVPKAMGARIIEVSPLPSENIRRARALSLEERQMLRRQIDEVGHDIYAPRR